MISFDQSDALLAQENAEAGLAQTVRQVRTLFNNVDQAQAVTAERKIALQKPKLMSHAVKTW